MVDAHPAWQPLHYTFSGFFQPVDNPGPGPSFVFDTAKAGSAVPVKFSLGGNQGLSVFALGYPDPGPFWPIAYFAHFCNCASVEQRISATELARKLGDVLARVRYRGDSFVVERNGAAVARVVPHPDGSATSLREALAAWRAAGEPDAAFADDLERVNAADRPPQDPWAS